MTGDHTYSHVMRCSMPIARCIQSGRVRSVFKMKGKWFINAFPLDNSPNRCQKPALKSGFSILLLFCPLTLLAVSQTLIETYNAYVVMISLVKALNPLRIFKGSPSSNSLSLVLNFAMFSCKTYSSFLTFALEKNGATGARRIRWWAWSSVEIIASSLLSWVIAHLYLFLLSPAFPL